MAKIIAPTSKVVTIDMMIHEYTFSPSLLQYCEFSDGEFTRA